MKFKSARLRGFKALDAGKGEFEAIVAVFGNVDLGGDRIVKGAFADSLKAWESKGRPIPVVFSHDWGNLDAHIGEVISAKETDEGLHVRAQLDMDDPPAAKVFRLMQRGTLAEFSFAYDIVEEKLQNGANELLKLDVIEVGPTLKGMNPETQLLGVKALIAEAKADAEGSGRKQAVAGSFEERRELVSQAVRGRYGENDRYWVWVVATYDDSAIVAIHGEDGASYRQIDYTLKDGELTLGEERDVSLQTVIVPKSRTKGEHAPPVVKPEDRHGKGEEPQGQTMAARSAFDLLELGFR